MFFIYPAVFHRENGSYWVEFPDLEGCQSAGDGLEDIMANAQEALSVYILTMIESESSLPAPRDIIDIQSPPDGFTSLVSCDVTPYKDCKSVKKTLTIPSWLNDRALSMGVNFSKVLQDALLHQVINASR